MLNLRPLSDTLGAEISGIDLATPPDAALFGEILAALIDNHVIVIPGQALSAGAFAGFARLFGRPQPHILDHLRDAEYPEILALSNVFENGEPTGVYDGAAYWHTDMSYEAEPAFATLVYSIAAPADGGDTRFANMARAYDALPDATKQRIDALTVVHHYGNRADLEETSSTSASELTEAQKQRVDNVHHPLVMRHPISGRKALYGVAGSAMGIVGWPDDEAIALLDELTAHATAPRFVHAHRYAVGDVVVWDNSATLHAATLIAPATGPADTRLLQRISVKGTPAAVADHA